MKKFNKTKSEFDININNKKFVFIKSRRTINNLKNQTLKNFKIQKRNFNQTIASDIVKISQFADNIEEKI